MDFFISNNLKFLRKINGLSQDDLSKIASYSFRTISKWETGESVPDYDNLLTLSKFFNVPIDDLMEKDLSVIKDLHRYSSKLIDNQSNFLIFQKELYKYIFAKSDDELIKTLLFQNKTLIPESFEFSDQLQVLLKREKLDMDKADYILRKALDRLKSNSLIDYYDLILDEDKFLVRYKITL